MSGVKRKVFGAKFKAKCELKATQGVKTNRHINEISREEVAQIARLFADFITYINRHKAMNVGLPTEYLGGSQSQVIETPTLDTP